MLPPFESKFTIGNSRTVLQQPSGLWGVTICRRMAILRGVEDGFSIARAPRHGTLSVSDSRGRVLAERSTTAAPFSTILTQVQLNHKATLYSRGGNWFAWCCITLLLGLLVFARPRPTGAAA